MIQVQVQGEDTVFIHSKGCPTGYTSVTVDDIPVLIKQLVDVLDEKRVKPFSQVIDQKLGN